MSKMRTLCKSADVIDSARVAEAEIGVFGANAGRNARFAREIGGVVRQKKRMSAREGRKCDGHMLVYHLVIVK
jgi:hypothetical protein